jgi:essential nuclear protein 1
MPRTSTKATGKSRHDPLLVQLREDDEANKYGRVSKPGRRAKGHVKGASAEEDAPAEEGTAILDSKTSRKIFELARDQQVELGVLDEDAADDEEDDDDGKLRPRIAAADEDEDEEYEVEEYEIDAEGEFVSIFLIPLSDEGS